MGLAQGIFLFVALVGRTTSNRISKANGYFLLLLLTTSYSFLVKIIYDGGRLFLFSPHFTIFSDFPMFVFGPLFFLFVRSRFVESDEVPSLIHFIPLLAFTISFLVILTYSKIELVEMDGSGQLNAYYYAELFCATMLNAVYILKTKVLIKLQSLNWNALKRIVDMMFVCAVVWGCVLLLLVFFPNDRIFSLLLDIPFIITTMLFYAISYLSLFGKLKNRAEMLIDSGNVGIGTIKSNPRDYDQLKANFEDLMLNQKIYIKSDVTLAQIAKLLNSNYTYLSRLINHYYGKTFTEFMAELRIAEFVRRVNQDGENFTYHGLANESGFKDKTTFNRTFKRIKGVTPKEYFASREADA